MIRDGRQPFIEFDFLIVSKLALMLMLVIGSVSCTFGEKKISGQTVLQVNEKKLSAKEFSERLARQLKKLDALSAKDPATTQRVKQEIVRNFILQTMTFDYAKANGIEVSDHELDGEINQVRSQYPDDLSFRRSLADESISLSEWRDQLRSSMVDKKVFAVIGAKVQKPSMEEVKHAYEEKHEHYKRRERVFLRQIVVDDLTKAETIKEELKKADFVKMASKYSVSPEGKSGGEVGWIEKGSVDIFDKAFSMSVGSTSQVLESSYGYHIFKVERKSPAGFASFDEVRSQIEKSLIAKREQAEFMGWLDQQIRNGKVFQNNNLIQALQVVTRGEKK